MTATVGRTRSRTIVRPRATALAVLLAFAFFGSLLGASSCAKGDGRTPVVVYSPHGGEMLAAFKERFERAHPEYEMQFLDLASQTVLDRLRAERSNPQCDVWWGASGVTFAEAAAEDLLDPYAPSWLGAIPPAARDEADRWVGIYETPEVIVYNSALVPPAEAPRDWNDLVDPRWKGQILIRAPAASDTMRTVFGAMILREWPKTNGPEGGYAWLRALAANTKDYPESWNSLLTSLNRQEAALTVWAMPDVQRAIDEKGYKLGINMPASGTPVVTDGIAIVRGAPHGEGARLLYEFVSSEESLRFAAEKYYRIPTRTDLDRATFPAWIRELDFPRQTVDREAFRKGIKGWMTAWTSEIRGATK